MSDELEKIQTRIAQLLAMAADTSSPHEAAIAARRARILMDKYQVELGDLKAQSGFSFVYVDRDYRFFPLWKSVLAVPIAQINDCKGSFVTQWKKTGASYTKQLMFQGYKVDVQLAKQLYEYLTVAVERLCQAYMNEESPGKYVASIGDAYKKGAARVLIGRLKELQAERMSTMRGDGTSLVLYKMAAVEEEFGKTVTGRVNIGNRKTSAADRAHMHGAVDAQAVSLAPQIAGNDLTPARGRGILNHRG